VPSGKSNPEITPGILPVGLIIGHHIRFNQESLPGFQTVFMVPSLVETFSIYNIVNNIIGPDRRAESVKRFALGVTAETDE
jgi:hypothetical protein